MYVQSDHPQAAVRILFLGTSIVLHLEQHSLTAALQAAAVAEQTSAAVIAEATTLLTDAAVRLFPACVPPELDKLPQQQARTLVRHVLDMQGITFCRPPVRE